MIPRELKELIKSDFNRYSEEYDSRYLLSLYFANVCFKTTVWYRIANYYGGGRSLMISLVSRKMLKRLCKRNHFRIYPQNKIGPGLLIKSNINCGIGNAEFGSNITLPNSITFATEKGKSPLVGNNVEFYPGVVIVGGINIGNNCIVAPNTVVTKDIPDNSIAYGVPNKNKKINNLDINNNPLKILLNEI